jgi:hypothetical protein
MPRSFLDGLLALGCAAAIAGAAQSGYAASAQVTIEVPQSKTRSVRLRNLPRGTLIGVAISASGSLGVALLSATQLKSPKPEPLFRGAVERKMSFEVVIPETSDYYLVLDNRRGVEPVKTTATIQAVQGKSEAPASPAPVVPTPEGLI